MRRILVVDDDRANVEAFTEILSHDGHSVQASSDADSTLHRIKAWKPQVLFLDLTMPGISGADLIARIRQATAEDYVSIISITDDVESDVLLAALQAGADDYVIKPFRPQELRTRVRNMLQFKDAKDALRRANHRIEEISSTDDLTGLLNMRTLHRKGEEEIVKARRFRKPVSGLIINLDRFSNINHEHGFTTGSDVIQEVGRRIRKCLRSIDMVARVGADEFFALLVETDLANAEFMAERIRDAIHSEPHKNNKHTISLSACIGVAGFSEDSTQSMSDLFHFASEALRSAKATGPDRIEIYSFA